MTASTRLSRQSSRKTASSFQKRTNSHTLKSKITPVPWGDFFFWFERYRSNVRYTVAIRQAPHPLQSFCVVKTQIRRLLACDLGTPCTTYSPSALRPLKWNFTCFGAGHIKNSNKRIYTRQAYDLNESPYVLIIRDHLFRCKWIIVEKFTTGREPYDAILLSQTR